MRSPKTSVPGWGWRSSDIWNSYLCYIFSLYMQWKKLLFQVNLYGERLTLSFCAAECLKLLSEIPSYQFRIYNLFTFSRQTILMDHHLTKIAKEVKWGVIFTKHLCHDQKKVGTPTWGKDWGVSSGADQDLLTKSMRKLIQSGPMNPKRSPHSLNRPATTRGSQKASQYALQSETFLFFCPARTWNYIKHVELKYIG